ncbi:MAG: hypothetical protein IT445_06055 [Phycisphaeraceae bacterium]|nr:hypothetical protein [Phycisphaeraceae bacterium]
MRMQLAIYEHAAALIGRSPRDVSRDGDLLVEAHATAQQTYGHRWIVAGIDVYNLEAEAFGAVVGDASDTGVPAIEEHPCSSCADLDKLAPLRIDGPGRLAMTLRAAQRLRDLLPGATIGVPLAGPFSVAAGLMRLDALLMELACEPQATAAALLRLVDVLEPWLQQVADSGFEPVVFESGVAPPMVSPALFEQVAAPALAKLLTSLGGKATLIIGGDTARIARPLLDLPAASLIVPRETDQQILLQTASNRPQRLRVNIDGRVFCSPNANALHNEVQRAARLVVQHPHAVLGSGVVGYDANPDLVREALQFSQTISD